MSEGPDNRAEPKREPEPDGPPEARIVRQPSRVSLAWLLPVLAVTALIVVLFVQVNRERGPTIVIRFDDAQSIEPGASIVHRGISVGVVRSVRLTEDLEAVDVEAELAPHARGLAVEGSRYWVVRPEVSLQGVEGLETIIGPRYIAVLPGDPGGPVARRFEGKPSAPMGVDLEAPGHPIVLVAGSAGTASPGSPVLYRGMPIGLVRRVGLAPDATHVRIEAEINLAYRALVRDDSRFWDTGGVGVEVGWFSGISLEASSLDSVLRGAVAMATPTRFGELAEAGAEFELAARAEPSWLRWEPDIQLGVAIAPE
ncbi:MAG: MlaD family protein [Planctomycetota bacterium]